METIQKKTIAIGDIHGRSNWKKIVKAHPHDRIVFLGDYCDPYHAASNFDILDNLLDIIALKTERKDDVVLLLGNHDMHYLYEGFPIGTRYNKGIADLIGAIFRDRRDYFQFAYQESDLLFTHAGVTDSWWKNYFQGKTGPDAPSIADQLSNPSPEQLDAMFMVGYARGGDTPCGGIFWADASELKADALEGIHQVVGHTKTTDIKTYNGRGRVTFCDCLENGRYFESIG